MPEKRIPSEDARRGARLPGRKKASKSESRLPVEASKPREDEKQSDIKRGVARIKEMFKEFDFQEQGEAGEGQTGKGVLHVKSESGRDVSVIIEYSVISENLFKIKISLENVGFNFRPEEQELKISGIREKLQQAELMAFCGKFLNICFDWARVMREDYRDKIEQLEEKYGFTMDRNAK